MTLSKRRPKEDPKRQLAQLTEKIIDKLQILALRRPRALIIVAEVIDRLLNQQLDALDDDSTASRTGSTRRTPISKQKG